MTFSDFIKTLLVIGVLMALVFIGAGLAINSVAKASTDFGNYNSTRIVSTNASTTNGVRVSGPGTFGSVTVLTMSTSTAGLGFYNGTSTATSSATLLFTVPTTTPVATYTFDIAIPDGLIIDVPFGFAGQVVVTHRL